MKKGIMVMAIAAVLGAINCVAQSKSAAKGSTAEKALDSLIGHSLYACRRIPESPQIREERGINSVLGQINPTYFDAERADGSKILNSEDAAKEFPLGSKLIIQGAELAGDRSNGKFIEISLNIQNVASKVSAGVVVEVETKEMTPARVLNRMNTDWFRTHPIPTSPKLGISEDDLYCIVGIPDHRNTDARGDDQLVYWDGQMYVYIGKNGRVIDIQTSFR